MASNYFGVSTSQIAVIGDGLNDILMFANAGLTIAMGNAPHEVQRMVRYVTKSNEEDGFANAIDQIILGQERKPEEKTRAASTYARLPLRPGWCPYEDSEDPRGSLEKNVR